MGGCRLRAGGLACRRIEHAHKRFLRAEMPRVPWLDQLTLPQLDKLVQVHLSLPPVLCVLLQR